MLNKFVGNKKRPCYPLRRPVIEAEPLPKTGSSNSTLPSTHAVEPKILDLLSMADHRMSCLSHEVTKLKGELSLQTDNVYTLQNQVYEKYSIYLIDKFLFYLQFKYTIL